MNEQKIRDNLVVLIQSYKAAERLRARSAGHGDTKVKETLAMHDENAERAATRLVETFLVDLHCIAESLSAIAKSSAVMALAGQLEAGAIPLSAFVAKMKELDS